MDQEFAGLVRGLVAGDEAAFADLYDRFAARLFRYACRIAPSPAEAEDAVQDVFVAVAQARANLPAVRNLTAYLFAATHRAAIKLAKHHRRAPISLDATTIDVSAPANAASEFGPETGSALSRAVAALPVEQRAVLGLKIDGGLTFEAIGEALGISPNTAASRYRYALEKLRERMETLGYAT